MPPPAGGKPEAGARAEGERGPADGPAPLALLVARAERGLKTWSWLNLRLASNAQEWLRRRFTPAGQVVLATTFTAGLFGIDTRLTAAHQAFAFGLALLGVGWLSNRMPLPRMALDREPPGRAAVGLPCRYRVRVRNAGRRLAVGLTLQERLPDPRPDLATFLGTCAPVERNRSRAERLLGYPRWEWLVRHRRGTESAPPMPVPDLAPDAELALELSLLPSRRGWLQLDGLVLARVDVLGLTRREQLVPSAERLLILPRRYPANPPRPPGRRRLQPGGVELAASAGDSREFVGLRGYLPGDEPRHIHWAAWARSGEPVVKEYRDEYFSRQALVLDTCPPADGDAKRFETAVSVAASLIAPLGERPNGPDGLLDLILYADGTRVLTAGRGLLSIDAMLETLACVQPQPPDGFRQIADTLSARAAQQSACLLVLSAWDDQRRALIEGLRRTDLPVTVLLIGERAAAARSPADCVLVDTEDPGRALNGL